MSWTVAHSPGFSLRDQVAEVFTRQTDLHQLTVRHDDGLYRHLQFRRTYPPGHVDSLGEPRHGISSEHWFDLVTWPGSLTIDGDMGTYTFARVADMFGFFRQSEGINPEYWAEKARPAMQPAMRRAVREFSQATFRQIVREHVQKFEAQHPGLGDAVQVRVFDDADSQNDAEAHAALNEFEFEGFQFTDAWEWSFYDYRWHYLWCCHAIQWGIAQYDEAPAAAVSS